MFSYSAALLAAGIDSPRRGTSQDLMAKDAGGITGKILCEIARRNPICSPGLSHWAKSPR